MNRRDKLARAGIAIPEGAKVLVTVLPDGVAAPTAGRSRKARYTPRKKGERNKLEARYEAHLEALKLAGEICEYAFEPEKFRLANEGDACFFTPDFRVLLNDGTVEFHDTKGFMEEDALLKIKWFVQQHPYPLVVAKWAKGEWIKERWEP